MAEIVSQEESLDMLLLIDMYCKNYRNDSRFWEQASQYFLSSSELHEMEICPDIDEEFPDDCLSPYEDGRNHRQMANRQTNGNFTKSFFIVSNTGCLFGDYDHEQRL